MVLGLATTMLLRSSSTPGLCSLALGNGDRSLDRHGETSVAEYHSKPISSTSVGSSVHCSDEWDFERELVPWPSFRKVQSENDLGSCCSDSKKVTSTPKKATPWSRRMSLIRHSSLPVSVGTSSSAAASIVDELQAPLPGLLETGFSEDDDQQGDGATAKAFLDDTYTSNSEQASVSGRFSLGAFSSNASRDAPSHGSCLMEAGSLRVGTGGRGGGGSAKKKRSSGGGGGDGGKNFSAAARAAGAQYQKLIECDPGQPLLLRNYARYLHEVERDLTRAEEYYGRAILAAPEDAELRSLYAKFVWDVHKDAERAGGYFEQAAQADPDDCYILGAYASFMWDTEEQEVASASHQTIPLVAASA